MPIGASQSPPLKGPARAGLLLLILQTLHLPFFSSESILSDDMRNIKKLRFEAGLTQQELADRLKVSRTTVNSMENDESYAPSEELLRAVCDLFKVNAYDVCDISDILRVEPKTKTEAKQLSRRIKEEYDV